MKFEDRSQEEFERQQRCARGDAWRLAKHIYKLKEKEKTTFFSPADEWILPAASTIKPEEREFAVDSGASMDMVSRKDLNSRYGQRRSANERRSDSVCQRIGFIRDSDASRRCTGRFLTRKTLRRSRICPRVDQWSEATTHQRWQENQMQHCELCTFRCPWFIDRFFNFIFTYFSYIIIAGYCDFHATSSIKK